MAKHTQNLPAISDASKRTLESKINSVTVDTAGTGSVTVNFTLKDGGVAVTDPTKFKGLSFSLAKLVPGVDGGSSHWVSYTGRFRSKDAAQPPVSQGYAETALAANLTPVAATPGNWTYKFQLLNFVTPGDVRTGITNVLNASTIAPWNATPSYPLTITYQATLTHRVAMMVQTNPAVAADATDTKADAYLDFVPAGGNVTTTRNIVTSDNCSSCHADRKWHRGYNTQLCVTCHNPGTFDPFTGNAPKSVELQALVHKIHKFGANYSVNGETFGSTSSTGGFPGELKNCQACHVESNTAAKDAANWRNVANKETCGTCHDSSVAVAHIDSQIFAGVQTCSLCHAAGRVADVQVMHAK
jgi:OmcA/MtrC family decaheme c-type cytochrome